MARISRGIPLLAVAPVVAAACTLGPTSGQELCAGFDRLDAQLAQGNGIGNPLFDAVEDLADLADNYPSGVQADAAALHAVADDTRTDSDELRNATMQISALCGRPPVGLGELLDRPQ